MTRLTTFREAAKLVELDPENPDFTELFLAALDLADERSELEFRACELSDKITALVEQMQRVTAAEAAQILTEIKTGKRQ